MNYTQTLDFLFSKLPIYQRQGSIAYKTDLNNIISVCKKLNNPHNKFRCVHIAGTNGKGSVSHMLSSILQEAGYKVGLYTSPHFKDFRERIKISGKMISKKNVVDFVKNNKFLFEDLRLSFFEMTVAMAFDYFKNKKIDIAIIETGLGGRLDSTNIITPEISIITNIGLDHTDLLGNSLNLIAKEKGGIIKKNIQVVLGRKQKEIHHIFKKIASEKNTKIVYSKKNKKFSSDLLGEYQNENISTTVSAVNILIKKGWKITESNIKQGLLNVSYNTKIIGRWQVLNKKPLTICDMGHNIDGIKQIIRQIKKTKYRKLHFLIGFVKDKKTEKILKLLPKNARYYFCKANIERGLCKEKLKQKAVFLGLNGESYNSVKSAYLNAKKNALDEDLIFIAGSAFVIAEII